MIFRDVTLPPSFKIVVPTIVSKVVWVDRCPHVPRHWSQGAKTTSCSTLSCCCRLPSGVFSRPQSNTNQESSGYCRRTRFTRTSSTSGYHNGFLLYPELLLQVTERRYYLILIDLDDSRFFVQSSYVDVRTSSGKREVSSVDPTSSQEDSSSPCLGICPSSHGKTTDQKPWARQSSFKKNK